MTYMTERLSLHHTAQSLKQASGHGVPRIENHENAEFGWNVHQIVLADV